MPLKLTIILLLLAPFNGLTQSFFWKIDANCFIISLEDLNGILNEDWVQRNELTELKVKEFKDSLLSINTLENPYKSSTEHHIYLSENALLTYFVETKCSPKIVNDKCEQTESIKKKVKAIPSPLGCSIYQLEFRTKKQKKVVFNEKVIVGICS